MGAILWLNDQPLWASALILFGGAISVSIIGTAISGLFFGEQQLGLNNIVGGFQYLFISSVYAGFLGFLLFGVYNRFDQVRAEVVQEVNILTTLDRLAAVFPAGTRDGLRAGLKDYARQVVEVEWPQLQNRSANVLTTSALDTLVYTYSSVEPVTKKQRRVMNYSSELLATVRDKRGVRVFRSFGAMQVLLWVVTLVGTAVSIVFPWVFGTPNVNAKILMSVLSTVLMTSVVLVVLKLSYPFSGSSGIPPTPYTAFIQEVSTRDG